MKPLKSFNVFGEPVDILTNGELTGGQSSMLIQTSPPGGGPPPHWHRNEDETFYVLEGEFEFLNNGAWTRAGAGEPFYAPKGSTHTFRNAGSTTGRMLVIATPSGLETYLEEISPLSMPGDMPQLLAISERYGITFAL